MEFKFDIGIKGSNMENLKQIFDPELHFKDSHFPNEVNKLICISFTKYTMDLITKIEESLKKMIDDNKTSYRIELGHLSKKKDIYNIEIKKNDTGESKIIYYKLHVLQYGPLNKKFSRGHKCLFDKRINKPEDIDEMWGCKRLPFELLQYHLSKYKIYLVDDSIVDDNFYFTLFNYLPKYSKNYTFHNFNNVNFVDYNDKSLYEKTPTSEIINCINNLRNDVCKSIAVVYNHYKTLNIIKEEVVDEDYDNFIANKKRKIANISDNDYYDDYHHNSKNMKKTITIEKPANYMVPCPTNNYNGILNPQMNQNYNTSTSMNFGMPITNNSVAQNPTITADAVFPKNGMGNFGKISEKILNDIFSKVNNRSSIQPTSMINYDYRSTSPNNLYQNYGYQMQSYPNQYYDSDSVLLKNGMGNFLEKTPDKIKSQYIYEINSLEKQIEEAEKYLNDLRNKKMIRMSYLNSLK